MRAAIYARVSTDEQTCENQILELQQVIKDRGWNFVKSYIDHGISGAKGRDKRPALDELLKDCTRGKYDVVLAWSVDRLGRSLKHLIMLLDDLNGSNTGLYLHQQALDTTTPSGRAMFQMVGVFAEFERSMISERVRAGLARARANGVVLGARSKLSDEQIADIQFALKEGKTVIELAADHGVSRQTIYRVTKQA